MERPLEGLRSLPVDVPHLRRKSLAMSQRGPFPDKQDPNVTHRPSPCMTSSQCWGRACLEGELGIVGGFEEGGAASWEDVGGHIVLQPRGRLTEVAEHLGGKPSLHLPAVFAQQIEAQARARALSPFRASRYWLLIINIDDVHPVEAMQTCSVRPPVPAPISATLRGVPG